MAEQAAATADPDERLVRVGPLARILTRPDIGALVGAVAVFFAFAYFARAVNWIGDPGIAAGWTDQAAQFGIVAVPVALLKPLALSISWIAVVPVRFRVRAALTP